MKVTTWGIEGMQTEVEKHVIFRDLMPDAYSAEIGHLSAQIGHPVKMG